jgi:uncharacterized protein (TIGR03435 family)
VISGFTLRSLIAAAYRLPVWQISGGEGWIQKDIYLVEGQPPENLRSSIRNLRHTLFGMEDERLCEMLQTLVADRFQLRFHRETSSGDVYLLERTGKPLGLQPAETHAGKIVKIRGRTKVVREHWIRGREMGHLRHFNAATGEVCD